MKTTLDLPVNLLDEVMRVGKCVTKTATVIRALEQMVRSVKLSRLMEMRGTMPDFTLVPAFAACVLDESAGAS